MRRGIGRKRHKFGFGIVSLLGAGFKVEARLTSGLLKFGTVSLLGTRFKFEALLGGTLESWFGIECCFCLYGLLGLISSTLVDMESTVCLSFTCSPDFVMF